MAITQSVTFKTSPEQLYNALLSATVFGEVTGEPAEIDATEGASFACFGGKIVGRQIVLDPNKRIIQAWRASPWDDGAYSIVRFDISGSDSHCELTLHHTGYPDGGEDHLEGGWHKMYWEPLQVYFS